MRLLLDIGHYDNSGTSGAVPGSTIGVVSESFTGADHGALLGCAEGLPGRPEPDAAAKSAMLALRDAYYSTIEAVPAKQALTEAMMAANLAVRAGGERGRAAVLGAMVLRRRHWLLAHVGNVRAWQCRDQRIKQLTRDHVLPRALRRPEVTRACGLADALDAEYSDGDMKEGDIYLLTSAGVHDALSGSAMLGILQSDRTTQQMAEALVEHASTAQAPGYAGASVVRVEKLPADTDAVPEPVALPMVRVPEPGDEIDGFVLEKVLIKGRHFRLYKAKDREDGKVVTLRFPVPAFADSAQAFLREDWASRQIESPFILKPAAVRTGRRTALYSVLEYRHTENLAKRIRRKQGLPLAEALRLGGQLFAALETLHEQGLVHGDVRANSLLYDQINRQLWMLGQGAWRRPAAAEDFRRLRSNTLSYWAPELFEKNPPTERSDLYAAGVALYRMLTGKYPYGRIRSAEDWVQRPAYVPIARHKEGLPDNLDDLLQRACAIDPARRYASAAECTAALDAITGSQPHGRPALPAADSAGSRWPWWLAACLAAALAAYLYFTWR